MSPVLTTVRAERRLAYVTGHSAGRAGEPNVVPERFADVEEFEYAFYCGHVDGYNSPIDEPCNAYEAGFDYDGM